MYQNQNQSQNQNDELEAMLVEDMALFSKDPLSWAKYSFEWGEGQLKDRELDPWQEKALVDIREGLKDVSKPIQIAVASGHGIGKSAEVSLIILWALSTRENTKVLVTANTETQLKTKTWAELAKWHGLFIAKHWFKFNATNIHIDEKDPDRQKTWRADMVSWSEHNTEAFAGLHNQGNRIVIIFDEASAIHDKVWEVTEGALTDKDTEIIWIAFGNPTRSNGRFFDCFNKLKHRWINRHIDSRTVKITNKKQIQQWIDDYGEDSDFVRVRVRGVFPSASDRQFISRSIVELGFGKTINRQLYEFAPIIIGVDPAWCFDDKTEILTSEGFKLFSDLTGIEKVYSIGLNNDCAEWMPITHIHKFEFNGMMNECHGNRGVDFCITDNHKLVYKSPKGKNWKLGEYKNLPGEFKIRRVSGWNGSNKKDIEFISKRNQPNGGIMIKSWKFDMLLWAKFLGWFISEGCAIRTTRKWKGKISNLNTYVIEISQIGKTKVESIKNLLDSMKIKYTYRNKSFVISNTVIGKHLIKYCGKYAKNKRIPSYIKNATPEIIKAFLDTYGDGDGHKTRGGCIYFTTSKLLADDIQECLLKIGKCGKVSIRDNAGSKFKIGNREVIRKNTNYTIWQNKSANDACVVKSKVKKVYYKGFVYCVTTPYHTIMVRRNGICMWSGNSGGDETVIYMRQGLVSTLLAKYGKLEDDMLLAGYIAQFEDQYKADAVFIDLGYGTGVFSAGKQMGRNWQLVSFASASNDPAYLNKRGEIWGAVKRWLKEGGCLPPDETIAQELTGPEYSVRLDGKIVLESKEDMKKRGLASPNRADALALTFSFPVIKKSHSNTFQKTNLKFTNSAYTPF